MQFLFPVDGESGTQKDTLRFTESHLTRHSFLSATDLEGGFFSIKTPWCCWSSFMDIPGPLMSSLEAWKNKNNRTKRPREKHRHHFFTSKQQETKALIFEIQKHFPKTIKTTKQEEFLSQHSCHRTVSMKPFFPQLKRHFSYSPIKTDFES